VSFFQNDYHLTSTEDDGPKKGPQKKKTKKEAKQEKMDNLKREVEMVGLA